jgi:hypothetical protein
MANTCPFQPDSNTYIPISESHTDAFFERSKYRQFSEVWKALLVQQTVYARVYETTVHCWLSCRFWLQAALWNRVGGFEFSKRYSSNVLVSVAESLLRYYLGQEAWLCTTVHAAPFSSLHCTHGPTDASTYLALPKYLWFWFFSNFDHPSYLKQDL